MVLISQRFRPIGTFICSKKVLKISGMYIFSNVSVKSRIANSNMDSFSSFPRSLFAVLIFHFEMGDVSLGIIVRYNVLVNCTGEMTTVFSHSIP